MDKLNNYVAVVLYIALICTAVILSVLVEARDGCASVLTATSEIICRHDLNSQVDRCLLDGEEMLFPHGQGINNRDQSLYNYLVVSEVEHERELELESKKIETLALLEQQGASKINVSSRSYSSVDAELRARQIIEQSA